MDCYAVIDTNVLVAALLSSKEDAATVQVLNRIINGIITPIFSEYILNEYKDVLHREKFGFADDTIDYFLSAFETFGIYIEPSATNSVLPDINDVPDNEAAWRVNPRKTVIWSSK